MDINLIGGVRVVGFTGLTKSLVIGLSVGIASACLVTRVKAASANTSSYSLVGLISLFGSIGSFSSTGSFGFVDLVGSISSFDSINSLISFSLVGL